MSNNNEGLIKLLNKFRNDNTLLNTQRSCGCGPATDSVHWYYIGRPTKGENPEMLAMSYPEHGTNTHSLRSSRGSPAGMEASDLGYLSFTED